MLKDEEDIGGLLLKLRSLSKMNKYEDIVILKILSYDLSIIRKSHLYYIE